MSSFALLLLLFIWLLRIVWINADSEQILLKPLHFLFQFIEFLPLLFSLISLIICDLVKLIVFIIHLVESL